MQIGDKIEFSRYEWQVLDIQNNAALIITEDMVELRAYHNKPGDITWADCELRKYLNGEFYDRFSKADKVKVIPTTILNPDNPWFGTIGGEDTRDNVFLLSIEEVVCKYFGDSSENLRIPNGKYKYWFAKKGLNVNDPKFGAWVKGGGNGGHQSWSNVYNQVWDDFIRRFPDADAVQIEQFYNSIRTNSQWGGGF